VPRSGISAKRAVAVVRPKPWGALEDGAAVHQARLTPPQGAGGGVDRFDLRISDPRIWDLRIDLGKSARGLPGEQRYSQRFLAIEGGRAVFHQCSSCPNELGQLVEFFAAQWPALWL
jgi:hypothetical protein